MQRVCGKELQCEKAKLRPVKTNKQLESKVMPEQKFLDKGLPHKESNPGVKDFKRENGKYFVYLQVLV